jgi:hypothetical protein
LRDCVQAHAEAKQKLADRENEIARLESIIGEAAKSDERLAEVVGGEIGPDLMASTISIEVKSRAAKIRLPRAQAELDAAKAAAARADHERVYAAQVALRKEADKVALRYTRAMKEANEAFDALVAISAAIPAIRRPDGVAEDDIAPSGIVMHLTWPLFQLPSNSLGTAQLTIKHIAEEYRTGPIRARWAKAREMLLADPEANISALLAREVSPDDADVAIPSVKVEPVTDLPPGVIRGTNPLAAVAHGDGKPVGFAGIPWNPLAN